MAKGGDPATAYKEAQKRIAAAKRQDATTLDLTDLGLTTLPPEIGSLTALQTLNLDGNQLTTLPPEIGSLTALQTLRLESNQLTTLPPEIGSLTSLQELYLSDNQLTTLPPEIGSLTALQGFGLFGNQLTMLPPEIGSLTALQTLDLDGNPLITLPPVIGLLTALQSLDLRGNQLTTLPPEIGSLTALQTLILADNQLTTLPPEIGSLTALQTLILADNQLTTLPPEIGSLIALQMLFLHENPALGLPAEVLGPSFRECRPYGEKEPAKPAEILAYYFRTAKDARKLREVKLILVGRGEVGKTTLAEALQGKPFKKNRPPTDGISITRWPVKPRGGAAVIRIWDFGGQEIMHGTHQFFLTRRAIYLVMVDGRDDRYQREAEYWLKLVRAFGGDSTVMIVMNRQKNYKFDLDRNALVMKYGVSTDHFFATECSQKATIGAVRQAIHHVVADILSTQANFPAEWWEVKTHLEQMKDDCLSDMAYREECGRCGVTDSAEQDELLDRLNDLGTIVHFKDDNLADLKVLNPEWATDGVYRVVTDEKLREEKHGKLRIGALKEILPKKRWPDAAHRRYILDLMLRFDLCFPAEGEPDTYIVAELLPEKTPDLADWDAHAGVVFRYEYPILPHGILPRFISKTHQLSEGQHRWRSGVVIAKDGAEALVRADYDASTVDIWVRGKYRDIRLALLTIIRGKFDEIHSRFKELNPVQMVGIPRDPKVFVSYRDMILDERDGKTTVRVTIAGGRVDVPLDEILSGVESIEERKKAAQLAHRADRGRYPKIVFGDNYEGDHVENKFRDNYGQIIETMYTNTNAINIQPQGQKKELLEKLRQEVERLIKNLPQEKKDEAPQVAKNLEKLVEQATSDKPNRKWYSVSAQGLLKASSWTKEFAGNIFGTVGQIGKLIWPDYSPPKAD